MRNNSWIILKEMYTPSLHGRVHSNGYIFPIS